MHTPATLKHTLHAREATGTATEPQDTALWSVLDLAQRLHDYATATDTPDKLLAAGRIDEVAQDTAMLARHLDDVDVVANRCLDVIEHPQEWADPDDATEMAEELVELVAAMMERQQAA